MANPTHLEHIGQMIKLARTTKGLTQDQLAEAAVMQRQTIVMIEAGKTNFEINTLVRIANALNMVLDITLSPV